MGLKERIELKAGDVTEYEVDAIVHAINNDLILGGGVSGEIRRKGGPSIQEECNRLGAIPMGEAAITPGGGLRARWVVHAASMKLGGFSTAGDIRRACENSLNRVDEKGGKSVAFSAIGTGAAGFSADRCAQIMFEVIWKHLGGKTGIERVVLVIHDPREHEAFKAYYEMIKDGEPGSPLLLSGTPITPPRIEEPPRPATTRTGPRGGPPPRR